jgi:phosphopantothenoylcysteine decarboxylase/phosphopantothenate--cysteine ligase
LATVLVTAGPTREYFDAVRFLSNASSGRMGYAIARAAAAAGHRTILVSGPTELGVPAGVECVQVISAVEMHERAVSAFETADVAFGVAAVADYRPARRAGGKPPKAAGPHSLELVPNPDVVAALGAAKGRRVVVGFALEVGGSGSDAVARARDKLQRKRLDAIVVNDAAAIGGDVSAVTLVLADGREEAWPCQDKDETAARLVRRAVDLWQHRREEGGAGQEG